MTFEFRETVLLFEAFFKGSFYMPTIESQDMTLEKLFDEFYVIPDYQREYVWEEKEVNEFIQDIYEEFSEQIQNTYSEYF